MNIFTWLYQTFVFRPELNLLQLFYNLTNDIGLAIILLATIVNVCMWPLFIKTYLNGQKMKYLQPKLKEIQETYKTNQQEMIKKTLEFNKKHGINNASFLYVIVIQILLATGLWTLIQEVSANKIIDGLYEQLFSTNTAQFSTRAFGFLDIKPGARDFIWLPILNSILSLFYGLYSFKWVPKLPQVPEIKPAKPKDDKNPAAFDPASLQKSIEFQTIYVMPFMLLFFNYNLPIGVNIYFTTVSCISLVRQIFITKYYASHTRKFVEDLEKDDPNFDEDTLLDEMIKGKSAPVKKEKAAIKKITKKKVAAKRK
jgi:YidC/Oxa1 family membrane protein insertase